MPWIRVDTNLEMERKFQKLDGCGRALIQFLWRLAKKNEGLISVDDWDPEYFASMICFRDSVDEVKRAMDKVISVGYIEPFDGGPDYFVHNWDKYQKPKDRTNSERQRRFRGKKSNGLVTGSNGKVTPLPTVSNGCNGSNGVHDRTVQDSTDNTVQDKTKKTFCPVSSGEAPDGIDRNIWESLLANYGERLKGANTKTVTKLGKNLSSTIYSGVDVAAEIERAAIWEDSNPTKKKTRNGIPRFLTGWMDRAQNSPRNGSPGAPPPRETPGQAQHRKNMEVIKQYRKDNDEVNN